jgi:hypothetical protein
MTRRLANRSRGHAWTNEDAATLARMARPLLAAGFDRPTTRFSDVDRSDR